MTGYFESEKVSKEVVSDSVGINLPIPRLLGCGSKAGSRPFQELSEVQWSVVHDGFLTTAAFIFILNLSGMNHKNLDESGNVYQVDCRYR